jgi:hypothetical protein
MVYKQALAIYGHQASDGTVWVATDLEHYFALILINFGGRSTKGFITGIRQVREEQVGANRELNQNTSWRKPGILKILWFCSLHWTMPTRRTMRCVL